MNILPKKRWHVRNKDNVAKVRRDEQKAKEDAEEAEKRRELAEQEAKVEILRRKLTDDGGRDKHETSSTEHFNFFKEFEQESKAAVKPNKDYEKEKKTEKEDFEKKIGLLTYLGQSVSKGKGPWYAKRERKDVTNDDEFVDRIDEGKKFKMDPMQDMKRFLKETSKCKDDTKQKRKKKHKDIIDRTRACPSSKSTMEELRAKRLQRERDERRKADLLLGKVVLQSDAAHKKQYNPARYYSQFNPGFARQTKERSTRPY